MITRKVVVVFEYEFPDEGADAFTAFDTAMSQLKNAVAEHIPYRPENITAHIGASAEAILNAGETT